MEQNTNLRPVADWKEDVLMVERLKAGDQGAYSQMVKRFQNQLLYLTKRMVKSQEDAEDLTMEIFGKVFRSIDSYKPEYAFKTWLFRIANNHCIDFIRKKKLQTYSLDESAYSDDENSVSRYATISDDSLNPEEVLVIEQRHAHLRQVIQELKPKYRELIELRYFEEKSYEEIEEILGVPMGTVKARLFRAKELLQSIMTKNPNF